MTDWRDDAACRDTEPDAWHLPGDSDTWEQPRHDDHRKALKAICGTCPVVHACAVDAIKQGDQHTFRGGMTPNERAKYARRLKRPTQAKKDPA